MLRFHGQRMAWMALAGMVFGLSGCVSLWRGGGCSSGACSDASCQTCSGGKSNRFSMFKKNRGDSCGQCGDACGCTDTDGCSSGKSKKWWKGKGGDCDGCGKCGGCCFGRCCGWTRSLAIQDEYPLGAVMRAHLHQMQTNAEAADFILFQMDFVGQSAELTPDGKDKVLEMAARMRSAPFPVVIERTWNNADPELDAHRREIVAMILADLGNTDAASRVFVAPAYGPGKHSMDALIEFWQYTYQGYMGGIGGGMGGGFGGGMAGGFGGGLGGGFGF